MMLNLVSQNWAEFFIGGKDGIFEIASSASGIDKNKLDLSKDENLSRIPYITRTELQNGISFFIANQENIKYKVDENKVITIGLDTQTIFFQPHKFYTGQNIQVLRHPKLNKFTAHFIISLLKVQMAKFNWGGNGATLGRLNRTKIMLPSTQEGQPDWEFMENHSKQSFKKQNDIYINYCQSELNKLEYKEIPALQDKKWGDFFIEAIADIISGQDIYDSERILGNTPYISSSSQNNGISYFVSNTNKTLEANCLSVNRNGSVGYAFYHPYEGLFSNDCRKLRPKCKSKFVGLFLANQITRQKNKYNYGYKMGTARLKRQKIMLPINHNNQPDYEYMEQYMINLELIKRKQYLAYIEAQEK
ncbi:restriction endonuclease subunit S [Acinetobacter sp.]|uniref:restriction endonuclease subunit S n=1 Tax=Acinetobacter sp. TaxID=472 RepID=UPI003C707E50